MLEVRRAWPERQVAWPVGTAFLSLAAFGFFAPVVIGIASLGELLHSVALPVVVAPFAALGAAFLARRPLLKVAIAGALLGTLAGLLFLASTTRVVTTPAGDDLVARDLVGPYRDLFRRGLVIQEADLAYLERGVSAARSGHPLAAPEGGFLVPAVVETRAYDSRLRYVSVDDPVQARRWEAALREQRARVAETRARAEADYADSPAAWARRAARSLSLALGLALLVGLLPRVLKGSLAMNDPRVDDFLHALRGDLLLFFPRREADERTREIAAHLEQAIAERAAEPDPVAAAIAEFGDPHGYRLAAEHAPDGLLRRRPEREVVRLAALALLVPIGLDLLMDASSWITGGDSSTALLSVPLAAILLLRLLFASTRSRRFLFVPIAATTILCFALFWAVGSWVRATGEPGGIGTVTRGTAYARRNGLVRDSLPAGEARLAAVERGVRLFAAPEPTRGVGEFRVAAGYLVPTIPDAARRTWKGDPQASRWLVDGMRYEPVADYTAASQAWKDRGPEVVRLAQGGVQGDRAEIDDLARVVACPWWASLAAQQEPKSTMGLVALVGLLLVHGLGVLCGAIGRHLGRRRGLA